jgi:hypothetical protein
MVKINNMANNSLNTIKMEINNLLMTNPVNNNMDNKGNNHIKEEIITISNLPQQLQRRVVSDRVK